MSDVAPAGYYEDPESPARERYWDGSKWTNRWRPVKAPETPSEGGMSNGEWVLLSALVPFVGVVMGCVELGRGHRGQGVVLLVFGVISIIVWAFLVAVV